MCALEAEFSSPAAVASADAPSLRDVAHDALQLLMAAHPELTCVAEAELWIERAEIVLAANVASGRFANVCRHEQDSPLSLARYAHQVLSRLMAEWDRVEGLRAGDGLRWTAVLKQMERQAYFWLGPTGREEWARWEACVRPPRGPAPTSGTGFNATRTRSMFHLIAGRSGRCVIDWRPRCAVSAGRLGT